MLLGASGIADPVEVVEGGFNRLGRRRLTPGGQRFASSAQMLGYALSNPRERRSKPLLKRVRKRRGRWALPIITRSCRSRSKVRSKGPSSGWVAKRPIRSCLASAATASAFATAWPTLSWRRAYTLGS